MNTLKDPCFRFGPDLPANHPSRALHAVCMLPRNHRGDHRDKILKMRWKRGWAYQRHGRWLAYWPPFVVRMGLDPKDIDSDEHHVPLAMKRMHRVKREGGCLLLIESKSPPCRKK